MTLLIQLGVNVVCLFLVWKPLKYSIKLSEQMDKEKLTLESQFCYWLDSISYTTRVKSQVMKIMFFFLSLSLSLSRNYNNSKNPAIHLENDWYLLLKIIMIHGTSAIVKGSKKHTHWNFLWYISSKWRKRCMGNVLLIKKNILIVFRREMAERSEW